MRASRLGSIESEARRLRERCDGHGSHSSSSTPPPQKINVGEFRLIKHQLYTAVQSDQVRVKEYGLRTDDGWKVNGKRKREKAISNAAGELEKLAFARTTNNILVGSYALRRAVRWESIPSVKLRVGQF